MKNQRLNLADFKAKAENTNSNQVLEKIQGGAASDCHGYWGSVVKSLKHGLENWYKF